MGHVGWNHGRRDPSRTRTVEVADMIEALLLVIVIVLVFLLVVTVILGYRVLKAWLLS